MSRRKVLLILIFAVTLYMILLFVPAEDHVTTGVVHYPISGITVMPGDPHLVSDETDDPIVEVTEFDFSMQSWVYLILYDIINLPVLPVWPTEILIIIVKTITGIITLVTSGYLLFFYSRKLSTNLESRPMQILAYIRGHPGAQESEIVSATGFSRGSVSYNLHGLLRENKIRKVGTCYYPAGENPGSCFAVVLKNPSRLKIVTLVLENPGISQKELTEKTAIPSTTLRWHIRKLTENGILSAERVQNAVHYTVTPEFAERHAGEKQGMR